MLKNSHICSAVVTENDHEGHGSGIQARLSSPRMSTDDHLVRRDHPPRDGPWLVYLKFLLAGAHPLTLILRWIWIGNR